MLGALTQTPPQTGTLLHREEKQPHRASLCRGGGGAGQSQARFPCSSPWALPPLAPLPLTASVPHGPRLASPPLPNCGASRSHQPGRKSDPICLSLAQPSPVRPNPGVCRAVSIHPPLSRPQDIARTQVEGGEQYPSLLARTQLGADSALRLSRPLGPFPPPQGPPLQSPNWRGALLSALHAKCYSPEAVGSEGQRCGNHRVRRASHWSSGRKSVLCTDQKDSLPAGSPQARTRARLSGTSLQSSSRGGKAVTGSCSRWGVGGGVCHVTVSFSESTLQRHLTSALGNGSS